MVATELSSGRDTTGGSIECVSEKEVSGESIVVLYWKGHFGGTQTHTHTVSLSPSLLLLHRPRYSERVTFPEEGGSPLLKS